MSPNVESTTPSFSQQLVGAATDFFGTVLDVVTFRRTPIEHLEKFTGLVRNADWEMVAPGEFRVFDKATQQWYCLGQNWAGPDRGFNAEARIISESDQNQFRPDHPFNVYASGGCGEYAGPTGRRNVDFFMSRSISELYRELCQRNHYDPVEQGWVSKVNEILHSWDELKPTITGDRVNGGWWKRGEVSKDGITVAVHVGVRGRAERPDGGGPVILVSFDGVISPSDGKPVQLHLSRTQKNYKYLEEV